MIFVYDYRDKLPNDIDINLKDNEIQHILAWRLLKYIVNNYTDFNFDKLIVEKNKHSKPYFKDCNLKFNLSHCKGIVVCIISDYNVGIDLEIINKKVSERVLNRCFDKTEQDIINNSINQEEYCINFYRYWTLKECFVKTTGYGLSQGLKNCVFYKSGKNNYSIKNNDKVNSDKYIFKSMLFLNQNNQADYVLSACCEKFDDMNINDIFTVTVLKTI